MNVASILLDNGADVLVQHPWAGTAFDIAQRKKFVQMISLLSAAVVIANANNSNVTLIEEKETEETAETQQLNTEIEEKENDDEGANANQAQKKKNKKKYSTKNIFQALLLRKKLSSEKILRQSLLY